MREAVENSQAVSEPANSSGVNIWFQSEATNNKFCVLISVWAPGATQNQNQNPPLVFTFTFLCVRVSHSVCV